jgi:hypothetical protein
VPEVQAVEDADRDGAALLAGGGRAAHGRPVRTAHGNTTWGHATALPG